MLLMIKLLEQVLQSYIFALTAYLQVNHGIVRKSFIVSFIPVWCYSIMLNYAISGFILLMFIIFTFYVVRFNSKLFAKGTFFKCALTLHVFIM